MKLNSNERALVHALVDYDANVNKAVIYLKETYGITADFSDDFVVRLSSDNINESNYAINMIAAKEYLNELFVNEMLTIVY